MWKSPNEPSFPKLGKGCCLACQELVPESYLFTPFCSLALGDSALWLECGETIHVNFLYVALFLHYFVKKKACDFSSTY